MAKKNPEPTPPLSPIDYAADQLIAVVNMVRSGRSPVTEVVSKANNLVWVVLSVERDRQKQNAVRMEQRNDK